MEEMLCTYKLLDYPINHFTFSFLLMSLKLLNVNELIA